ncbi:protein SUPPRESSOR OF GENE SILENCING 3, partial [Musa troglodytarum]
APLEPWGSSISSPKAAGSSSGKDCAPLEPWGSSISSPNAGWSCGNKSLQNNKNWPPGRGNSKQKPQDMASAPVIPPPLPHGWQRATRFGPSSSQSKVEEDCHVEAADEEEEEEIVNDSGDSDHDTDASQRGQETRRKNKWLQKFFREMDI